MKTLRKNFYQSKKDLTDLVRRSASTNILVAQMSKMVSQLTTIRKLKLYLRNLEMLQFMKNLLKS